MATAALHEAITSGDRDAGHGLAGHGLAGDGQAPLLLAISDNGPQMRSVTTGSSWPGGAIAQQSGRPHTPQDQAWTETLSGHVTGDWPHLEKIRDPPAASTLSWTGAGGVHHRPAARRNRLRHPDDQHEGKR